MSIEYVKKTLLENRGLARLSGRLNLAPLFTFSKNGPRPFEDFDPLAVGPLGQSESDQSLVAFVDSLPVSGVILQDPWSKVGDLRYVLKKPTGYIEVDQNIYYIMDVSEFTHSSINEFRGNCVSYLKIVYFLDIPKSKIIQYILRSGKSFDSSILRHIKSVFINAFDDTGWVGALSEPSANDAQE